MYVILKSIFRDHAVVLILTAFTLAIGIYSAYAAWQLPATSPWLVLLIPVMFLLVIVVVVAVVLEYRARRRFPHLYR
jgi:uncharacterized membrane protein YcjF (UPF0283 family)